MRTNWNKLVKSIPTKIKAGPNKGEYEILLIKDFHGQDTYGETRFDPKQIVLRSDLKPKLMMETFWHEFCHAISEEHNVGLTEQQILDLESAFPYFRQFFQKLEGTNE